MSEYAIVGSDNFSRDLAKELDAQIIGVDPKRFPDNESKPTVNVDSIKNVRNKRALIVSRTDRLNPNSDKSILEIGFVTDTLRRYGIEDIDLLVPYMYYARQDRESLPGEPRSFTFIAEMLEDWGYSNIFTVNSHLYGKGKALKSFFNRTKIHDISASKLFSEYLLTEGVRNPIVLGPGKGPEKMAIELSAKLGCDYECLEKVRDLKTQKVSMKPPQSNLLDRDVIIYDDISGSAKTILEICNLAREHNPYRIFLSLVHILTSNGIKKLYNLGAYEIITTDSLIANEPKQYTELSLVPLISDYIRSI